MRRTEPRGLPGQFSPAAEVSRIGSLTGFEQQLLGAEGAALENTSIGEGTTDEPSVALGRPSARPEPGGVRPA